MSRPQSHPTIRRAITEIFNDGHLETADALFALDYVNHGGVIPDLVCGPEAVKIAAVLYRRAFPSLHVTVVETRVDGEMVWVRWLAHRSKPSTRVRTPVESEDHLDGATLCRIVGSQIVESWTEWDQDATMWHPGLLQ